MVERLRVEGRNLDPLLARLRVENLLQGVEMHPAWLAPSAIVCLRRVRDPLPGALSLSGRDIARETLAWQQSVHAAIEQKIRLAARPFDEEGPAAMEAVIFRDHAELLACLAMDEAEGRIASRWWWRSLFKDQDASRLVYDAWLHAPQYVPAAFELLTLKRHLKPFIRSLSTNQARSLLAEVTRCFALKELQAALNVGFEKAVQNSPLGAAEAARLPDDSPEKLSRSSDFAAPWQHLVPESSDDALCTERKCLLGVALMIRRSPRLAHSSAFARATLNWLLRTSAHDLAASNNSYGIQQTGATLPRERSTRDIAQAVSAIGANPKIEKRDSEQEFNLVLAEEFIEDAALPEAKERAAWNENAQPSLLSSDIFTTGAMTRNLPQTALYKQESSDDTHFSSVSSDSTFTDNALVLENSILRSERAPLSAYESVISTKFGGIFYLINLALFLELYSDFTLPTRAPLNLPIFDFIALVALSLLNDEIKADPVWKLLAQMRGRAWPGEEFEPPDEWRVPVSWLDAFPEECALLWTTEDARLRVEHPAGFLLLDVPLSDEPMEQLKREMEFYDGRTWRELNRAASLARAASNRLERWLELLMPYIRARLDRALDISEDEDAGQLLCAQRARVLATATHMDIFFSLSEHPLKIRLAGLDRNPGWVPAAGRFIAFHYS